MPLVSQRYKYARLHLIATLVVVASLILLWAEWRHGIGVTPDSAIFVSAADSLVSGHGLTTEVGQPRLPLTHHPPLYPLLLAAGKLLTGSYYSAAMLLNLLSFASCCLVLYLFMNEHGSPRAALIAIILLISSTALYSVDYSLGTDGLAIPGMLTGLYCLSNYQRTGRFRALITCAVALSLASLLRYSYVAFLPAMCLALMMMNHGDVWKKLRLTAMLAGIAGAPTLAVLAVNKLLAGNATNRVLALHPVSANELKDGIDYLSGWLLPYRYPLPLRTLALLFVAAIGIVLPLDTRIKNGLRTGAIFISSYVILVLISISLFDGATPLSERLLAPVIVIACAHIALIACWIWSHRRPFGMLAAAGLVLFPSAAGLARVLPQVVSLYQYEEQGNSIAKLRNDFAEIIPILQTLPSAAPVYSNVPHEIYLVTGRPARALPVVKGYTDEQPRTEAAISSQVHELAEGISRLHGLVLYKVRTKTLFDLSFIDSDQLFDRLPLSLKFASQKFVIYGAAPADEAALTPGP